MTKKRTQIKQKSRKHFLALRRMAEFFQENGCWVCPINWPVCPVTIGVKSRCATEIIKHFMKDSK